MTEYTSDANGGYDLGYAADGSYAVFRNVDFGASVSGLTARVADTGTGTSLEFHLDSPPERLSVPSMCLIPEAGKAMPRSTQLPAAPAESTTSMWSSAVALQPQLVPLQLVVCLSKSICFQRPKANGTGAAAFPQGLKPSLFCGAYVRAKARTLQHG